MLESDFVGNFSLKVMKRRNGRQLRCVRNLSDSWNALSTEDVKLDY